MNKILKTIFSLLLVSFLGCRMVSGPCFSHDGKFIYFSLDNREKSAVYKASSDGSGFKQISFPGKGEIDVFSGISRDGKTILFARSGRIFSMNSEGSELIQLTRSDTADRNAIFSPDGQKIYFLRQAHDSTWEIYSMNSDGSNAKKMGRDFYGQNTSLAVSPDGKELLVTGMKDSYKDMSRRFIHIFKLDDFVLVQSIEPGIGPHSTQDITYQNVQDAVYSPDGRSIAFVGFSSDIYWMDMEQKLPKKVTDVNANPVRSPSFSPDGGQIAFCAGWDYYSCSNLWVVKTDGSEQRKIKLKK